MIERARNVRVPYFAVTELNERGYRTEFCDRGNGVCDFKGSEHRGEIEQMEDQDTRADGGPMDLSPSVDAGE